MTEGSEAADQVVKMMLSGGEVTVRLAGSALKNGLAMLLALMKNHKKVYGKTNMVKLLRETRDIRTFAMTPKQFRAFQALARRHKLLYAAVRDRRGGHALIDVVLPSTEIARANTLFGRFKFTPPHEERTQTEREESTPKKERRSGPGSRDTRENSSTRDEKQKATNERPSIEGRLAAHKVESDEQLRQVPTKKRIKSKLKSKVK